MTVGGALRAYISGMFYLDAQGTSMARYYH